MKKVRILFLKRQKTKKKNLNMGEIMNRNNKNEKKKKPRKIMKQ